MKARKHILSLSELRRAQTILEAIGALFMITFFFASAFFFMTITEVAQKQTMLVRAQAFLELGNYSTYALQEHGKDEVSNDQSKIMFMLGENTAGTRVDLASLANFQQAFQGEMSMNVADSDENNRFWRTFRFPKAFVRFSWSSFAGGDELQLRNAQVPLHQVLGIVHNRSISFEGNLNTETLFDGSTGLYSGSVHFKDLSRLAQLPEIIGEGLIDNTAAIEALLAEIVRDDPSLAEEARDLRNRISGSDAILGGAQSSLISAAISNALALGAFAAAGGFSGAAGAGGGLSGVNLIEGAHLHNFGQLATFSGNLITTGAAVASAFGSHNENLFRVGAITSGVGSIASGFSDFGKFQGNEVYTNPVHAGDYINPGLASNAFGGVSQILGGTGNILGATGADSGVVMAFQAGSMVSGFGGSLASFSEGMSGADINPFTGEGSFRSINEAGEMGWRGGGQWAATSAVGGLISGGAGIAALAGAQGDAVMGVGLLGSGVSLAGGAGSLAHSFETGKMGFGSFDDAMASTAAVSGIAAGAAGVTAGVASLAGADSLAETAAYTSLGASVVSLGAGVALAASTIGKGIESGAEKLSGLFDKSEGGEDSSSTTVTVPDNRSSTQKLEDGLNTFSKMGNVAVPVAMAGAAIKQGNDAVRDAERQAAESLAAAEASGAQQVAAAQEALQQAIAARDQAVNDSAASSSSAGASSGSSASQPVSSTPAQVAAAQNILRQMDQTDFTQLRMNLSANENQQLNSAIAKAERARSKIEEAQNARLSPDSKDIEELTEAYAEILALKTRGSQPTLTANAGEGNVDVLGVTYRLEAREFLDWNFHQQNITNRLATQFRRNGPEESLRRFNDARIYEPSILETARRELAKVDRQLIQKAFSDEEAHFMDQSLRQLEESLREYDRQMKAGETPSSEQLQRDRDRIEQMEAMIDRRKDLPLRGSAEREIRDAQLTEENRTYLMQLEIEIRKRIDQENRAYQLVEKAENQVQFRPILSKNRAQRLQIQKLGNSYAQEIASFREQHLRRGTEEYERFRAAEWSWRRLRFQSYRDYIQRVNTQLDQAEQWAHEFNDWLANHPRWRSLLAGIEPTSVRN